MTIEHQIPNRVKNYKDSINSKLKNVSPEMLDLAFALVEKWLEQCCNCKDRHICWSGFLAMMGVTSDNLSNAVGEQFSKCEKLYCWNVSLEGFNGRKKI